MRIDSKTVEKSLLATISSLQQSYMMTEKINAEEAKVKAANFLRKEGIEKLLSRESPVKEVKRLYLIGITMMLDKYKDKRDKAYLALYELRDMLS